MNRKTFRLVLLVSCAHAMAHVFELSLPSVEHDIASEYPGDEAAGKILTGWLSFCWRLPWGVGALLVGVLVDRYGSPRMLAIYLLGCALTCLLVSLHLGLPVMFAAMFLMGSFASIYHPAGLPLISHCTTPDNRPRALGMHGVIGSAGIAMAPLMAGILLHQDLNWRDYYLLLALPGILLGGWFLLRHRKISTDVQELKKTGEEEERLSGRSDPEQAAWLPFLVLTILAALQGMIYAGVLTYLRRYLGFGDKGKEFDPLGYASYMMAVILLCGCIGQYIAGRIARSRALELQLTVICLANAPFLVWMGMASGTTRYLAAAVFSIVHFMNQPIYNSLVAKYTPSSRRSVCYGFSFMMGFGIGGLGAPLAGYLPSELLTYLVFSGIAVVAGGMGGILWWLDRATVSHVAGPQGD